ncbi:hypothetical protein NC653_015801 [Populus alba x Populus x berolinensis]|uniref:Uncharacterized protein n=1 Tax=Populus alba x Populus x berolinensis TaxID=444605 RepID=A0AAD6VYN3_9ROSI|nr:hypothetical protein NC653_015801 [Populus alba x Populus x berolinensis]
MKKLIIKIIALPIISLLPPDKAERTQSGTHQSQTLITSSTTNFHDILGILPYALALKWETTPIFCLFDDINR